MDLKKALAIAVAFVAPIQKLLGTTLLLVFADLVTGIWAAKKRGEVIKSKKLKNTVTKILAFELGIVLGHLLEVHFIPEIPVVRLVAAAIGMTEMTSIFENLRDISGVDFMGRIRRSEAPKESSLDSNQGTQPPQSPS